MNYNDQFDDLPRGGFLANVGPKAGFFIVLIALSFMVGVVWKLYSGSGGDAKNVPIVRADTDSFKVVPEDPGGMEIRHKDSTLFSAIKKEREEEETKIENLLADDENEEPMPRSQLFAGLNTDANQEVERNDTPTPLDQPMGATPTVAPEEVEPAEGVAEEPEPMPAPPKVELKSEETQEAKPVEKPEEKIAATQPQPVTIPAPAPVEIRTDPMPVMSKEERSSGSYYIQLASTKDKARAETEWKKLSQKYSVISDLPHRVETADLGEKGTYYRIQAGPMSREAAQSKCAAIKKINPNGCLVKK